MRVQSAGCCFGWRMIGDRDGLYVLIIYFGRDG